MRKNVVAIVALVAAAWAGSVYAEPISFRYNIQITERCDPECSPFSTSFPLMLTFDSDITFENEFEREGRLQIYGKPRFSTIPLERPPVAANASDFSSTL